jgi:hypothetical protein
MQTPHRTNPAATLKCMGGNSGCSLVSASFCVSHATTTVIPRAVAANPAATCKGRTTDTAVRTAAPSRRALSRG